MRKRIRFGTLLGAGLSALPRAVEGMTVGNPTTALAVLLAQAPRQRTRASGRPRPARSSRARVEAYRLRQGRLSARERAEVAHRAESDYVGVNQGPVMPKRKTKLGTSVHQPLPTSMEKPKERRSA